MARSSLAHRNGNAGARFHERTLMEIDIVRGRFGESARLRAAAPQIKVAAIRPVIVNEASTRPSLTAKASPLGGTGAAASGPGSAIASRAAFSMRFILATMATNPSARYPGHARNGLITPAVPPNNAV